MSDSSRPSTPQASRRRRPADDWESDTAPSPPASASASSVAGSARRPAAARKAGSGRSTPRSPKRRTGAAGAAGAAGGAPAMTGPVPPRRPAAPARRAAPARPTLRNTLGYLLVPLQLLVAPVQLLLAPFITHALNAAFLLALGLGLAYLTALHGFSAASYLLRLAANVLGLPALPLPSFPLGALDWSVSTSPPVRALATPLCFLGNVACAYAYGAAGGGGNATSAPPPRAFWARPLDEQVDVARVAVGLTDQVRGAASIFESVALLAEGELASGLDYTHVLELGVAVKVGSTIEDKDLLADKITELGLLSRDIADGVMSTSTMSNSAIQWLEMDFKRLVDLLSGPSTDSAVVWRRLDRTLAELDRALHQLQERTAVLRELATRGVADGLALDLRTRLIHHDLVDERARLPGWRPLADRAVHFVRGGEASRYETLSNDIAVAARTLDSMRTVVRRVDEVRAAMGGYRDQLDLFRASVAGFHLGAGGALGLGPEEEVRTLAQAVDMFSAAAGKGRDAAARRREGLRAADRLALGGGA